MGKKKETDDGFLEEKEGYSVLDRDPEFTELRKLYKVPFNCYGCSNLMYNIDDKYFYKYGVCHECAVYHVLDRDIDPEILKDRRKIIEHVKKEKGEK